MLTSTAAFAQPELHVTEGFVRQFEFSGEPIASVSIGDVTVADAIPLTDHAFLVQSHKIGTTNMILLSKDRQVIDEIIVIVDRPISGLVRIHNKAMLNSYTEFSCGPTGCSFVGENTVTEPAPLPQGHVQQIFQGTYNQNGNTSGQTLPVPSVVEPSRQ
jgi:Flp pilus assembly secretin CpaC